MTYPYAECLDTFDPKRIRVHLAPGGIFIDIDRTQWDALRALLGLEDILCGDD